MASPRTFSDAEAARELQRNPGVRQASPDPTEATAETVLYMCELIHDSLTDGIVQQATKDADKFRQFARSPWASIWWWAKHHVVFVHHQKLLVAWLNAPDELQLLIRPDALLKMTQPKGDCAVFTTLICAMLDCAGLPWEICTVAVDPRQPGIYSHVYPRVILPDGRRIPLDASHGKWPGWEVPAEHVSAKQIWNSDGEPIEDLAPQFQGLHGVPMEYLYGGPGMPGEGMGAYGMGCDCSQMDDSGNCLDPDPCASSNPIVTGGDTTILPVVAGGTQLPQGPGLPVNPNNSPAALQQLSQVYSQMTGQPTQITANPNGTLNIGSSIAQDINALLSGGNAIARTATGQPAAGTATGMNTNTLLLIGGATIAVIVLVGMMGKK